VKIKKLLGYGLSSPFQNSSYLGYLDSNGLKNIGIVEVHTECGIIGYGESYAGVYCAELMSSVIEYLSQFLIGMDVDTRQVHNKIFSIPYVGRNGLLASISSAINVALYDIIGKKENKPIYKLLSKKPKKDIKAYASNGSSTYSVDEIKDDVSSIIDLGYKSYKMRIGYQDFNTDMKRVEVAKKELGNKKLMIDSIMGTIIPPWDLKKVLSIEKELKNYEPFWWEEPLHPADIESMSYLTLHSDLNIAGGEALNSKMEFDLYDVYDAVNIIQPDVTNSGGFDECSDICDMRFQEVALHVWGSGCAILSNLHMALSNSKIKYLEIPMMKLDITDEIMDTNLEIKNGKVKRPDVVGVGVTITDDIKEKYKLVKNSNYII
jgi:L-alanine-DL-glutamate epimerase-like enolase superfamily enzyme